MNAKKFNRYLTIAFVLGLVLSFGILYYAVAWLTKSSEELTQLRTDTLLAEKKRDSIEEAQRILRGSAENAAILSQVLPTDKDQAHLISQLNSLASQANIQLDSIGFPASTLGNQTPRPATTPQQNTTSDGTATTQTTTPAAPKTISQATPVKEIPGVYSIEVTLGSIRSKDADRGLRYDEMINFLRLLERNQRTIQTRSISIGQTATDSGEIRFTLDVSLSVFIRG